MSDFVFEKSLSVSRTDIPGLVVVDLSVHGDERGWFKENWQYEKMISLGLPDFHPVQNNISFNAERGVTRGIHAEPWNKFISIASGSAFGAWVDLRPGKTFGKVFTCVIDSSKAVYVPRGVGNSFQVLEDGTVYTYLVDAYWSVELKRAYTFVNLADPDLDINWPIPLSECNLSEADKNHPYLRDILAMQPKRTLVTGCTGQLGRAVRALAKKRGIAASFDFCDKGTFDISDRDAYCQYDWSEYGTVINCGAFTAVDEAETDEGRRAAWAANATGPALLSEICRRYNITLVHISSDYVFDGTLEVHAEDEKFSPLSVYGQSKAAGDLAVSLCPAHYILRSSWVIGEGHNFVKTMVGLAARVADREDGLTQVAVVNDQIGRLTFTCDMAEAIFWLLGYREGNLEPTKPAPYGVYNMTGSGRPTSWAEIAEKVFELSHSCGNGVIPVTTEGYYASVSGPIASRPRHSILAMDKIESCGYVAPDWETRLAEYVRMLVGGDF